MKVPIQDEQQTELSIVQRNLQNVRIDTIEGAIQPGRVGTAYQKLSNRGGFCMMDCTEID
ncbi:MAG: hypothetical protein L6Q53_03730 [Candidatus Brocadia sinica]|nr:hypothetical protein [Candidatus Brocadia sinica]